MRIGITGATGFIGSALTRRLLAQRASVRILSRPSATADHLESQGVEVHLGELANENAAARFAQGTDLIFHLAAKVDSPGTKADFLDANVTSTERILQACLAARVRRVVYLSSIAVYGLVAPGTPIDESTPFDDRPTERDSYAQSKILADQFAMAFSAKRNLPLTILRPGIVYGPGRPLPIALLGFRAGKKNVIFGNPSNRFPLIYVENLIDALQQAGSIDQPPQQQFIILDDDDLTLSQYHQVRSTIEHTTPLFFSGAPVLLSAAVLDAARRILPLGSSGFTLHQIHRSLDNRHYVTTKIRDSLNWSPKVPLHSALTQSLGSSPKPR
jgi:nucleoside-diphosphate-sugar epimerase